MDVTQNRDIQTKNFLKLKMINCSIAPQFYKLLEVFEILFSRLSSGLRASSSPLVKPPEYPADKSYLEKSLRNRNL